jgi:hypothetical protein
MVVGLIKQLVYITQHLVLVMKPYKTSCRAMTFIQQLVKNLDNISIMLCIQAQTSCRAMTFIQELVKNLVKDPSMEVYAAATAAYAAVLEPYHGFFARSAFAVRTPSHSR